MGDSPPFVNAVEGGAVTPRRRAGRAGQCAGRVGSKGSIASPRQPLPGFEGAESLASPAVIPRVSWLIDECVDQSARRSRRKRLSGHRPEQPRLDTVAAKLHGICLPLLRVGRLLIERLVPVDRSGATQPALLQFQSTLALTRPKGKP